MKAGYEYPDRTGMHPLLSDGYMRTHFIYNRTHQLKFHHSIPVSSCPLGAGLAWMQS